MDSLWVPRSLRIATDDFDFLGLKLVLIIELKVDILDQKSPDVIAKAVCIQVTLRFKQSISTVILHVSPDGWLP